MVLEKRILEELLKRLDEVKVSFMEHPAKDYEEYRERVGYHKGLKEAFEIINDIINDNERN